MTEGSSRYYKDGDSGNRDKYISYIHCWHQVNDTILWVVNFEQVGKVRVVPRIAIGEKQAGTEIVVKIGLQEKIIVLKAECESGLQLGSDFTIDAPGVYQVCLILKNKNIFR